MRKILVAVTLCAALPAFAQAQQALSGLSNAVNSNEAEAARLDLYKIEPIAKVAEAKRTIRRVTYRDAFGTSPMPAVTIEKLADGSYKMNMTAKGGTINESATITKEEWDKLVAQDHLITDKPKVQLTAAEKKLICHSNSIVIETSDAGRTKRRDASHCNKDTEAMLYGYAVASIAVANIPRCKPQIVSDREASWQLAECLRGNRRGGGNAN